jgi:hypothetical protein
VVVATLRCFVVRWRRAWGEENKRRGKKKEKKGKGRKERERKKEKNRVKRKKWII